MRCGVRWSCVKRSPDIWWAITAKNEDTTIRWPPEFIGNFNGERCEKKLCWVAVDRSVMLDTVHTRQTMKQHYSSYMARCGTLHHWAPQYSRVINSLCAELEQQWQRKTFCSFKWANCTEENWMQVAAILRAAGQDCIRLVVARPVDPADHQPPVGRQ